MNTALLVGINQYKYAPLRGCVNDAKNIYSLLTEFFGFDKDNIRVLFDERATKAGILSRLRKLVGSAQAGDHVFFSYSGHGSQVRDRDGDESLLDRMDEILCPFDIDFDEVYITDDELHKIFSKLPAGVKLTVILDCCHSGTGLRSTKKFDGVSDVLSRYLAPPIDIDMRARGRNLLTRAIKVVPRSTTPNFDYTLWSGCRSDQTSADARFDNSGYAGAFTHTFGKVVRAAGGDISREDMLGSVRGIIEGYGLPQVPQLETKSAQENIFS